MTETLWKWRGWGTAHAFSPTARNRPLCGFPFKRHERFEEAPSNLDEYDYCKRCRKWAPLPQMARPLPEVRPLAPGDAVTERLQRIETKLDADAAHWVKKYIQVAQHWIALAAIVEPERAGADELSVEDMQRILHQVRALQLTPNPWPVDWPEQLRKARASLRREIEQCLEAIPPHLLPKFPEHAATMPVEYRLPFILQELLSATTRSAPTTETDFVFVVKLSGGGCRVQQYVHGEAVLERDVVLRRDVEELLRLWWEAPSARSRL